ncbi:MAG TPA: radical SAM protein [Thermoplasmatales archaeon]|nr:radical SAM protein [Thermoplasmatales archaeon]
MFRKYVRNGYVTFIIREAIEVRIPIKIYERYSKRYSDRDIITYCVHKDIYNHITGRRLYYITEESGIPLIGHTAFGLIDRGTNLIQVRPCSGCNLNCIFCSVDEGVSKTRVTDYMVDPDYMIKEFKKLADFKRRHCKNQNIEAHIDGQGEPFIYPYIVDLIKKLKNEADVVSIQTNGTLLNERIIEELEGYLDRINLSINSLDEKKAKILAGRADYDINHVKSMAKEIANSEIDLLIAPVWVPGYNDSDILDILKFGKKIGAGKRWKPFGVQKYIRYRFGRHPKGAREMTFKKFYSELRKIDESLILSPSDFGIAKCKSLPKKFKIGEKVRLKIEMHGRMRGEMIAIGRDRVIQIIGTEKKPGSFIDARIVRNRHNVYVAVPS